MAALTNTEIPVALDAILQVGGLYLALYSTAQDAAESGIECTDANYARQPIAWNAASGGQSTNDGTVTFPALAADFTAAAAGVCDDPAAGNCLFFSNYDPALVFLAGQSPELTNATGIVSAT